MNEVCLSSYNYSGGMDFWWKDVNFKVLFYDRHYAAIIIFDIDYNVMWYLVGVYGWSENQNKY